MAVAVIADERCDQNRLVLRNVSMKFELFYRHPLSPHHPGSGQQTIVIAAVKYTVTMVAVRKAVTELLGQRVTAIGASVYHCLIYAAGNEKTDGIDPVGLLLFHYSSFSVLSSVSSSSSSFAAFAGIGVCKPDPLSPLQ